VKPAAFEYVPARTVDEALTALEQFDDEAKILAGGQSLVPMMNFRLARPSALIDIGRITGLDGIHVDGTGVDIGTLVTHRRLELGGVMPGPLGALLADVGRWIGHLPIRTRGTFGGSIAHADPASEWCVLAALLDADLSLRSTSGMRTCPASEFFVTVFTTALEPTEILTSVRLPLLTVGHRVGFAEFSRRAGDFAIVMAMTVLEVRDDVIHDARVALGGVAGTPVRAGGAEAVLTGSAPRAEVFEAERSTGVPQRPRPGDGATITRASLADA